MPRPRQDSFRRNEKAERKKGRRMPGTGRERAEKTRALQGVEEQKHSGVRGDDGYTACHRKTRSRKAKMAIHAIGVNIRS